MDVKALIELLNSGSNFNVTIGAVELKEFGLYLLELDQTKNEQASKEKDKVLLTTQQVCEILGVTNTTLWRWNKSGYLTSVKIGAINRYKKEDIDRILKKEVK